MICEFTGVVEKVATYDKGFTTVRDHADPDRHVEAIFPNWCDLREGEGVAVKGRLVSWVPWAQCRVHVTSWARMNHRRTDAGQWHTA